MPRLILLILSFLTFQSVQASHNRAGEIIYRQIGDLTIEASIITYTQPSSISADRDSLEINWGDGSSQLLVRVNGADVNGNGVPDGEIVNSDYKKNVYIAAHTYSQQGSYNLSMMDPNREHEILNINFPNPDAVPFYIQTLVVISTEPNNSPVVLQPPIDMAYVNTPFVYYPAGFDEDDDSIAYRMITPLMDEDLPVTNYQSPTEIKPGTNNMLSFDETTGRLFWESPQMEGIYNIAIEVLTYRDGVLNGTVLRDMQILVLPELNRIASITSMPDYNDITKVAIGDTVNIQIDVIDGDSDQSIDISVTSGLMDYFTEAPVFNFVASNSNTEVAFFSWVVKMEQVRKHPFKIVFRGVDNLGLANYKLMRFKVEDFIEDTDDLPDHKVFEIFPNPVGPTLFVKNGLSKVGYFQILSSNGRLIRRGALDRVKGIDVADLATGVYYLQLDGHGVMPFLKQ